MATNFKFRYASAADIEKINNLDDYFGLVLFNTGTNQLGFNIEGKFYWTGALHAKTAEGLIDENNNPISVLSVDNFTIDGNNNITGIQINGSKKIDFGLLNNVPKYLEEDDLRVAYCYKEEFGYDKENGKEITIQDRQLDNRKPLILTSQAILDNKPGTLDNKKYHFELSEQFQNEEITDRNCIVFWVESLEARPLNPYQKTNTTIIESVSIAKSWQKGDEDLYYQDIVLTEKLNFDASYAGIKIELNPTMRLLTDDTEEIIEESRTIYNEVFVSIHKYYFEDNSIRIYARFPADTDTLDEWTSKLSKCDLIVTRWKSQSNEYNTENGKKYKPFVHTPWSQVNTKDDVKEIISNETDSLYQVGDILTTVRDMSENDKWHLCDGGIIPTAILKNQEKLISILSPEDWNIEKYTDIFSQALVKTLKNSTDQYAYYDRENNTVYNIGTRIKNNLCYLYLYKTDLDKNILIKEWEYQLFEENVLDIENYRNIKINTNFQSDKILITYICPILIQGTGWKWYTFYLSFDIISENFETLVNYDSSKQGVNGAFLKELPLYDQNSVSCYMYPFFKNDIVYIFTYFSARTLYNYAKQLYISYYNKETESFVNISTQYSLDSYYDKYIEFCSPVFLKDYALFPILHYEDGSFKYFYAFIDFINDTIHYKYTDPSTQEECYFVGNDKQNVYYIIGHSNRASTSSGAAVRKYEIVDSDNIKMTEVLSQSYKDYRLTVKRIEYFNNLYHIFFLNAEDAGDSYLKIIENIENWDGKSYDYHLDLSLYQSDLNIIHLDCNLKEIFTTYNSCGLFYPFIDDNYKVKSYIKVKE